MSGPNPIDFLDLFGRLQMHCELQFEEEINKIANSLIFLIFYASENYDK